MSQLPDYVLRSPALCYVLGALIFVGYIGLGTYDLAQQVQSVFEPSPQLLAMRLRTILDALNYSFFFVTTGIFLKVQIAIWQAVIAKPEVAE